MALMGPGSGVEELSTSNRGSNLASMDPGVGTGGLGLGSIDPCLAAGDLVLAPGLGNQC